MARGLNTRAGLMAVISLPRVKAVVMMRVMMSGVREA